MEQFVSVEEQLRGHVERADVIVIGLGAMGSAAAYQLAKRGAHVIGIDRFRPPHAFGSTLGESRVTRVATAEGPAYVPFAARSQQLWRAIEAETGEDVFTACGVLMVGPEEGGRGLHGMDDWLAQTITMAALFGIRHEVLDGAAVNRRYPVLSVDPSHRAYLEPDAGFARPAQAVRAQLTLAERHGANLRFDCAVSGVRSDGSGVSVTTPDGDITADHAVISAGAWVSDFLAAPELRALFRVERQMLHWYAAEPRIADRTGPDACPVYFWADRDPFYGFPDLGSGIKVGTDVAAPATTPSTIDRTVTHRDAAAFHERYVAGRVLGASPSLLRSLACMYTVTPDREFVIDAHPEIPGAIVVSPCSGHSFKHSAAIGEALAQWILDGGSELDLTPFGFDRFRNGQVRST